ASHTLAVPSKLPVASRAPSGDQATDVTWPVCPLRVRSSRPLAASHTLAVPSQLPVATRAPSGAHTPPIPIITPLPAPPTPPASPGISPAAHPFAPPGRVPALGRAVHTPRRQPRPVRRPGHGTDHIPVADQGVLLQVAKPLAVIPLEAPVGVRLGLRQERAQPT